MDADDDFLPGPVPRRNVPEPPPPTPRFYGPSAPGPRAVNRDAPASPQRPPPPPDDAAPLSTALVPRDARHEDRRPWEEAANLRIQNVVSSVNLRIQIDCRKLATSTRNSEYNPKKFAAVVMRIREPRTTALVFASGKMVVTGGKSEAGVREAARKFGAIIKKVGFAPRFDGFTLQNVVGTADAGFPIRLEAMVYAHAKYASYEPELFPGLIYRLMDPKTVLLIFVSGRLVITGGKSVMHLRRAFEKMWPVLCEFRKETLPHARAPPALPPPAALPLRLTAGVDKRVLADGLAAAAAEAEALVPQVTQSQADSQA